MKKTTYSFDQPNTTPQDDKYLPSTLQDSLKAVQGAYSDSLNKPGLAGKMASHPFLTGLAGVLMGGPGGAFILPMIANKAEQNRKTDLATAYQAAIKNLYDLQKTRDEIAAPRIRGTALENALKNDGIQSPVPQGEGIDDNTFNALVNGGTSGFSTAEGIKTLQDVQNQSYNSALQKINGLIQASKAKPGQPMLETERPYISGQVVNQVESDQPLAPYHYRNPDLAKELINQSASVMNSAFGQVPGFMKTPGEISENQAQTQNSQALAKLHELMVRYYPQLIKSEINRNNRPPAGGGSAKPSSFQEHMNFLDGLFKSGQINASQYIQGAINPSGFYVDSGSYPSSKATPITPITQKASPKAIEVMKRNNIPH